MCACFLIRRLTASCSSHRGQFSRRTYMQPTTRHALRITVKDTHVPCHQAPFASKSSLFIRPSPYAGVGRVKGGGGIKPTVSARKISGLAFPFRAIQVYRKGHTSRPAPKPARRPRGKIYPIGPTPGTLLMYSSVGPSRGSMFNGLLQSCIGKWK